MNGRRHAAGRSRRRGSLLVEMVVALSVGLVLLASLATVVSAGLRWHRSLIGRADGLEVARTVWFVLEEELRAGTPGRDWEVDADGALVLRAFRGVGRVCGPLGPDWSIAYRGRRLPDPGRDSLLVLGSDGEWRTSPLRTVGSADPPSSCGADSLDVPLRMGWAQDTAPVPLLVRAFERGSYHLADGAFRYRRGRGGRQPLTAERLTEASRFRRDRGGLEVTLDVAREGEQSTGISGGETRTFSWWVGGAQPRSPTWTSVSEPGDGS